MEQYGGSIEQVTNTATAGGTTTLVNTSTQIQVFTGSTTQTVILPNATTYTKAGTKFEFYNNSTGNVTLQYQDTTSFLPNPIVAAGSYVVIKMSANGTANGTWVVQAPNTSNLIIPAQTISGSNVINWTLGSVFVQTLSANTTFTFSGAVSGQTIVVRLTNTGSNFTVTWPTVRWSGAVAPTMSPGAVSDVYTFIYDGSNYYGASVQNMS